MFHLAIVLLPLLSFALIATLATGAGLLITALMGGASAALLVKDKCLKRLVLLGCGILALAGIACVGLVLGWSYLVAAGCCLGAVVLAIVGLCGCRRISPLNVRIVRRKNANIGIGEHERSSFTICGRILVNGFLRCIYRSIRRIAPVNCALLEEAESRLEPTMSAGSAKP